MVLIYKEMTQNFDELLSHNERKYTFYIKPSRVGFYSFFFKFCYICVGWKHRNALKNWKKMKSIKCHRCGKCNCLNDICAQHNTKIKPEGLNANKETLQNTSNQSSSINAYFFSSFFFFSIFMLICTFWSILASLNYIAMSFFIFLFVCVCVCVAFVFTCYTFDIMFI